MQLRHLRHFLALSDTRNLALAAERLCVSKTAVSHLIRDLESELGIALFERRRHGMELTAAGRVLQERVSHTLSELDEAIELAKQTANGVGGRLRIGHGVFAVENPDVIKALTDFRERFPMVSVELYEMRSVQQLRALRARDIDVGFVYARSHSSELQCLEIAEEPVALAVPAAHRLARQRRVSIADLKDERFIWVPASVSPDHEECLHGAMQAAGFSPNIVQNVDRQAMALQLIAAGVGIGFVNPLHCPQPTRGVAVKRIVDMQVHYHLDLAWRSGESAPSINQFVQLMQGTIGQRDPRH